MSRICVLQHVECESPGLIARALQSANIQPEIIRTFRGHPVPREMGEAIGLVVMGGPMGVSEHDRYPFLRDEMRLIEQALREEKPILGVCLGSQLIASVLGATVTPGKRKEIGWHRITLTDAGRGDPLWQASESSFTAWHWHGDRFDVPLGAVSLASSELTSCQAFRYGTQTYGFLFHIEVTAAILNDMVATFADELETEGLDGAALIVQAPSHLPRLERIGERVYTGWVKLSHIEEQIR